MNHDEIENEQLLDLYLMGRLDSARQEQFEAHIIGCERCVEELELRRAFIGGMRQVPVSEFGTGTEYRRWRALALAASLLLAISAPLSIWSLHELGQSRGDSAALSQGDTSFLVMPLAITRGNSSEAANVIELGERPQWLVFEIEGDFEARATYAVRLVPEGADAVLRNRVTADTRGTLVVGLRSTLLRPGNYTLELGGADARGGTQRAALQVVRENQDLR